MMATPKTTTGKDTKKKEVDRSKPHLSIGTIGHVDAGKSTLSAAIIKLQNKKGLARLEEYEEIDKAPEEKTRGITINIKHIKFETDKRHYTLIDCPGHVDFLKNMILGASQMDGAILVVSDVGVQKQTREHLKLCNTLNVKHLIVLVNDKTNIDEETKALLTEDVQATLIECGYEPTNVPIVFLSALKALNGDAKEEEKLSKLVALVDEKIPLPVREPDKPFLMYIESKFQIPGQGTVVGGKVLQGVLKEGDSVQIVGLGKPKKTAVVRSMEMHKETIKDFSRPGDDVGVNLRGVDFKDIQKGQVVGLATMDLKPSSEFLVDSYIFPKTEGRKTPFSTGYMPQFFIHTANITGEVSLPEGVGSVEPDTKEEKRVSFKVKLKRPIYARKNDNFIVRESGKTVAMGFIREIIS